VRNLFGQFKRKEILQLPFARRALSKFPNCLHTLTVAAGLDAQQPGMT
jgi:hypothetical protein